MAAAVVIRSLKITDCHVAALLAMTGIFDGAPKAPLEGSCRACEAERCLLSDRRGRRSLQVAMHFRKCYVGATNGRPLPALPNGRPMAAPTKSVDGARQYKSLPLEGKVANQRRMRWLRKQICNIFNGRKRPTPHQSAIADSFPSRGSLARLRRHLPSRGGFFCAETERTPPVESGGVDCQEDAFLQLTLR